MPNQTFSELELRITEIAVKKQDFWKKLTQESHFEVKVLSVVSDGVSDRSFNLELGTMPVSEGGKISFGPAGYTIMILKP